MHNYHQPLVPGETYHLFSRAVGSEKLFKSQENYRYFLTKFEAHTNRVADLYTYTLIPNHFNLLVRIKPVETIIPFFEEKKQKPFDPLVSDLSDFIMERFSNWLNGYTKAFNKMYRRKGALFMDYLRRSHAKNDADFAYFVFYIHKNAVHHGLTKEIGEWVWDGYKILLNQLPTSLLRPQLLDFFGGKEAFVKFHQRKIVLKMEDWPDM
jgi:REP element-mobilizing transposase RayT